MALASLSLASGAALAAGGSGGAQASTQSSAPMSVAAAQRALGVAADGIIGPQTRRAVRRFQRAHGLTVTGRLDPRTLAALGAGGTGRSLAGAGAPSSLLARIARCESGGNPAAVSSDGSYRGKYQFTRGTWRALGGSGDPAAASEAEQDRRAAALLGARGTSPWPNCA